MSEFKDRLKEARAEAGLTQEALADELDVSQSSIGMLESGQNKTARNVSQIAAVLGVQSLWLETGKGPKHLGPGNNLEQFVIEPDVLALAQKLSRLPKAKLQAIAVLLDLNL
jgi:transcriptional regulator with XRE-family HTH domain